MAQFDLNFTQTLYWDSLVGNQQTGKLHVVGGQYTFENYSSIQVQHTLELNTNAPDTLLVKNQAQLNIKGLNLVVNGDARIDTNGNLNIGGTNYAGTSTRMSADRIVVGDGLGGGLVNVADASSVFTNFMYIDAENGSNGTVVVNGPGSNLQINQSLYVGENRSGTNTLSIENGGLVDVDSAIIGALTAATGNNTVNVTGTNGSTASTFNVSSLNVGSSASGAMNITQGGKVVSGGTVLGGIPSASGNVMVDGNGSTWQNANSLTVGSLGTGILNIQNSGQLNSAGTAVIGLFNLSNQSGNGTVNVNSDGTWNNQSSIEVGRGGTGAMNIDDGGTVTSTFGVLGQEATGIGTVNVGGTGAASSWQMSQYLTVGNQGTGQLNINTGGVVTVGTTTSINANSAVTMNGGTFNFGTTDLDSYGRIGGTSGKLIGTFNFSGFNDMSSLSGYEKPSLDISGVLASNSGTLYGTGNSSMSLNNLASGEVRTLNGEWARFAGGVNFGEINNYGGTIEFENVLLNRSEGLISGRGLFIANGGLTNHGVIAMSGGFSDFHGDVTNSATGTIAIGGGSVTTFYDDVMMDATNMNIDVAQNSTAVFFGAYNGGSNGLGDVHIFGDLRPGNSPASVFFGGNVLLGSNTFTEIELAGDLEGEFDKLNVAGDLDLAGMLSVSLIDDFQLRRNQTFIIADVDGSVFGQFSNFNDNDIVYTQGDIDLFITYDDGNGNVMLYSSIPEPSSAMLMLIAIGLVGLRRRTR